MSHTNTPQEQRAWAIEQAIKLHGDSGVTTEAAVAEAAKLLAFVNDEKSDDKPKT